MYLLGILVPKHPHAWHQALGECGEVIVKESNLSGNWPSEEVSFVLPLGLDRMEKEFSAVHSLADTYNVAARNSTARGWKAQPCPP